VRLIADGLMIFNAQSGETLGTWLRGDYVVESHSGSTMIWQKDQENVQLCVEGHDFARLAGGGFLRGSFAALSPVLKVGLIVGVVVAVGVSMWFGIDRASLVMAQWIPINTEKKIASALHSSFEAKWACTEPDVNEALQRLAERLAPRQKDLFRIIVVKDSTPNAFAFPGGLIAFTSGFLREAKSPEEIAGVLAHEMQHVLQRHIMATVVRSSILAVVWSVVIGDYAGLAVVDPGLVYTLVTKKFDRELEVKADLGALRMLDQAKIARRGFRDFFDRVGDNSELEKWMTMFSTHPASPERVAMIDRGAPKGPFKPAMSALDWTSLKHGCVKDSSFPESFMQRKRSNPSQ